MVPLHTSSRLVLAAASAFLLLAGPVLMNWTDGVASAQSGSESDERKTRKTPAMREQTYKKLSESREFAEAEQYGEAMDVLNRMMERGGLNSYEAAQAYNFYGYIYFSQERFQDAIQAYQNVLAQENLPLAMETATIYSLAQLYFAIENYDQAIVMINRWLDQAEDPGPEPYILLAQAYYQKKQYAEAITPVETAIRIAAQDGKPPKEQWLLLLRVFYFELEEYDKVAEILHQLLAMNPKREYWIQLSGIYGEREQPRKQLIAYEMAYLQGMLSSGREIVTLAQLYLQAEVPYKAGVVLEKGLNEGLVEKTARNYRLLSQAWTLAREDEKAIPTLRTAAQLSDDGELEIRLARAYANLGQWSDAVDAATRAISKGGLRRTDQANILLGMSLYNLERYPQAINAFRVAREDERSRSDASRWIAHIDSERQRQASLREAIDR
ncbi:MAG: tetratricopeptide repeat protein [Gammaproteobacteria bacterium]